MSSCRAETHGRSTAVQIFSACQLPDGASHIRRAVAADIDPGTPLPCRVVRRVDELRMGTRAVICETVPIAAGIHQCPRLAHCYVNRRRAVAESVISTVLAPRIVVSTGDSIAAGIHRIQLHRLFNAPPSLSPQFSMLVMFSIHGAWHCWLQSGSQMLPLGLPPGALVGFPTSSLVRFRSPQIYLRTMKIRYANRIDLRGAS